MSAIKSGDLVKNKNTKVIGVFYRYTDAGIGDNGRHYAVVRLVIPCPGRTDCKGCGICSDWWKVHNMTRAEP